MIVDMGGRPLAKETSLREPTLQPDPQSRVQPALVILHVSSMSVSLLCKPETQSREEAADPGE